MERRYEVCFVPKPKSQDRFLLKLRALTGEDVDNLDPAQMLVILGQVRKSVDRAENKARRNLRFVRQFIEAPQFH